MTSCLIFVPQTENPVKASRFNSVVISVSTTAIDCLDNTNTPDRVGVTVVNPGNSIAYIAIGNETDNAVSATNYAYLIPGNRMVSLTPVPLGELNVVMESGSASLTVIEFLK